MTASFTPRPSQQQILRYTGGRLGIAAVPGAGKTHILSALAAKIIHEGWLGDDQETWLSDTLAASAAQWKLLAQQVVVAPFPVLFNAAPFSAFFNSCHWRYAASPSATRVPP